MLLFVWRLALSIGITILSWVALSAVAACFLGGGPDTNIVAREFMARGPVAAFELALMSRALVIAGFIGAACVGLYQVVLLRFFALLAETSV